MPFFNGSLHLGKRIGLGVLVGFPGVHSGYDWADGRRPKKSGPSSTATFDWRRFISYENGKSAVNVKNARPGAQMPVRL